MGNSMAARLILPEKVRQVLEDYTLTPMGTQAAEVVSPDGTIYSLDWIGSPEAVCTCPSFEHRQKQCKHLIAARLLMQDRLSITPKYPEFPTQVGGLSVN